MIRIRVLFVCLGNICRSPAAEGAFKHIVNSSKLGEMFEIDSAGTGDYHIGELPHEITRGVARKRGIVLDHKARQFRSSDFSRFDYIIVMDDSNYRNVIALASDETEKDKVVKFRQFERESSGTPDVPDPYFGGLEGFENVQDIVLRSSEGLLDWIQKKHAGLFQS
ncbi:MAG: low molecular weight phosphotyrosine protein phosphatase [Leptospira sp.]|nr:low molecular weight phosphotyrosine protein phosphatase [Leptospira sp.]